MNGRTISLTLMAFVLGAFAAGSIGVRVIREVATAEDATSLPVQNIAPGTSASPFAVEVPFVLTDAEPRTEVFPGVVISLLQVETEGTSSVVRVTVDSADSATSFSVIGFGPGWLPDVLIADGGGPISLEWVDGPLPESISLLAVGRIDGDSLDAMDVSP